jgi:hypothetical protein
MKRMNPTVLVILCMLISWGLGFYSHKPTKYYDGNGNRIPEKAVRTLVESQFIHTTKEQDSILHLYYPYYDIVVDSAEWNKIPYNDTFILKGTHFNIIKTK